MAAAGFRISALTLLLVAVAPPSLRAQIVTGRVVDRGAGRGIAGAFVQLMDSAGARRAGALTDSIGRYVLKAPAAGQFRVHAERLGYQSLTSEPLRLGSTSITHDIRLAPQALVLPAVSAHADDRGCEPRPDGPAVYVLWEAVRKALTVASWSAHTRSVRYSLMNHVRELDPSLRIVLREQRMPKYALAALPYAALDPDHLAHNGYVLQDGDDHVLFAPDADVLLSGQFLSSHCFRLAASRTPDLVGLGFEPLRRDGRADVKGVLWIDRLTSELRYVAFEYENLPGHLRRFGASGEIHYERMANGTWIVQRWWIRSPLVAAHGRRLVLTGHREDGGTVAAAETIDTKLYGLRGRGSIEGVVLDGVNGAPLPDALVFLSGTPFSDATDGDGRYRIERVPAGIHTIGLTHAALEEAGVPLPLDTITVTYQEPALRTFIAPSPRAVLRALCPGEEEEATTGLIYGVVRDEVTGAPLRGVEVRVSWVGPPPNGTGDAVDRWRTAHTGADGRYSLCWVPTEGELTLRADSRRVRHQSTTVDLAGALRLRRDFE